MLVAYLIVGWLAAVVALIGLLSWVKGARERGDYLRRVEPAMGSYEEIAQWLPTEVVAEIENSICPANLWGPHDWSSLQYTSVLNVVRTERLCNGCGRSVPLEVSR